MKKQEMLIENAIRELYQNKALKISHLDITLIRSLYFRTRSRGVVSEDQMKAAFNMIKKYRNKIERYSDISVDMMLQATSFASITNLAIYKKESFAKKLYIVGSNVCIEFPWDSKYLDQIDDFNYAFSNTIRIQRHNNKALMNCPAATIVAFFSIDVNFYDAVEFLYDLAKQNQFNIEPKVEDVVQQIKEMKQHEYIPFIKYNKKNNTLEFQNLFEEQKQHLEEVINACRTN